MTPACPPGYQCQFDPVAPHHFYAHWWDGPWGIVLAILVVAAAVAILCTIAVQWHEAANNKRIVQQKERDKIRDQEHARALEEQRTMQIDACKGNAELLAMVREMQK